MTESDPMVQIDPADAPTIAVPPPKKKYPVIVPPEIVSGRAAKRAPAAPPKKYPVVVAAEAEPGAATGPATPVAAASPDDVDVPTQPLPAPRQTPGVIYRGDDAATQPSGPGSDPLAWSATCALCGSVIDQDGYCTQCGARAKSPRDHYAETPAGWVAGVCDIGLAHLRNEDALALAATAEAGRRAVLVVCDGVTTSQDSDVASLAGARAARAVLWAADSQGLGLPGSRSAVIAQALRAAVQAADAAVVAVTAPDSPNPASATFAAALLVDGTVHWANLGDSRVYWFADAGQPRLLSQDHSLAQAQIAEGVARDVAEASVMAHTITKWLGRDAVDLEPALGEVALDSPGWLLVCSDGLWNYASAPDDLLPILRQALDEGEHQPLGTVERLVAWANGKGGHDNITAALARFDGGPAVDLTDAGQGDAEGAAPDVPGPAAGSQPAEQESGTI
ncbi:MAG: protein phosphatase 2C domain-containing protein [Propionibacteriaceae bacterium]|jgi:serine/threonine protein phosphatase PrpC|nr:protein phosphatase 2C domain-containing protein [Propionibacteriaceae bacterium]